MNFQSLKFMTVSPHQHSSSSTHLCISQISPTIVQSKPYTRNLANFNHSSTSNIKKQDPKWERERERSNLEWGLFCRLSQLKAKHHFVVTIAQLLFEATSADYARRAVADDALDLLRNKAKQEKEKKKGKKIAVMKSL